jgi:hypothetical protein
MRRRLPNNGDVSFSGRPFPAGPYPEVEGNLGGLEAFAWPGNRMCKGAAPGNRHAAGPRVSRFNPTLRQAILQAAASSKFSKDGTLESYLVSMCHQYPRDYLSIVGRLSPLEIRAAITTFDSTQDIKAQLAERGIHIDGKIFAEPRISKPLLPPRPEPADRTNESDEDALQRQPVHEPPANGAHAAPTSGKVDISTLANTNKGLRDVRNFDTTISSPSLNGWHQLNDQIDLPLEDTE